MTPARVLSQHRSEPLRIKRAPRGLPGAARRPGMLREIHRTATALRAPWSTAGIAGVSITRARGVIQIALTLILVPLCTWVLFGRGAYGPTALSAASALLGAIVTFWLKD